MNNEKTCGECRYCDEDESWSEDDYFWFHFCEIGQGPEDGITTETPACKCFISYDDWKDLRELQKQEEAQ